MTSFITNGIVTLTIDGVTSFLQLHDVQNIRKNMRFNLNKGCWKLCVMAIDYEGFVFFYHFVFLNRNKFALAVICCLIYHCLSVSRK